MLSTEHKQRLLDIANAGCSKGLVVEARSIYEGLLSLDPGMAPASIGLAMSHIVLNEFDAGEELLREKVLAADPKRPMLLTLKSLLSSGRLFFSLFSISILDSIFILHGYYKPKNRVGQDDHTMLKAGR